MIQTQYYVKITIYKHGIGDKVVYYRNKLPMFLIEKYRWYFDYISARVKVNNPRCKIVVSIGPQDLLQGVEYVEKKVKSLLKAKVSLLNRLKKGVVEDDLFCFKSKSNNDKIEHLEKEIEALENGEFNYYTPPTNINIIKLYINQKDRTCTKES